jgi:membrane protease subunit (stomatin/prohibitin family)
MQASLHRPQSFAAALGFGPRAPKAAPAPAPRANHAQARAQRSGGPIDSALYACGCGCAFNAPVTTSVGCPNCGQTQAW